MSAGTAYAKRYAGGFFDKPSTASAIDSTFLNAVEVALLQLIGAAPTVDGQVMQWDDANTRYGPALLLNKNVAAGAAIAKSKLDFSGASGIVNADVAGAAAIARSKLDFGAGLVNGDISAAAAIALSKLNIGGTSSQYVRGDGVLTALPASPILLDYGTGTDVNTTAAETAYVSYSVPANTLGMNKAIMCIVAGDFVKGSAINATMQVRAKYGATTMVDGLATSLIGGVNSANRYPFWQMFVLSAAGSTSAQFGHWQQIMSWRSGAADAGQNLYTVDADWRGAKAGSAAEDSTAAKTFQLTMQWSASSSSNSWRPYHYALYLV